MASAPYQTYILLPASESLALPQLMTALRAKGWSVEEGETLSVSTQPDYAFGLSLEAGSHVSEENAEMLAQLGESSELECPRRLVCWGSTPDPDMEFFNDHLLLLEVLERLLPTALFFDPISGERLGG